MGWTPADVTACKYTRLIEVNIDCLPPALAAGEECSNLEYVLQKVCRCHVIHRSRIRYLSKKNSRIVTNFPKLKKFVKIRTKIRKMPEWAWPSNNN